MKGWFTHTLRVNYTIVLLQQVKKRYVQIGGCLTKALAPASNSSPRGQLVRGKALLGRVVVATQQKMPSDEALERFDRLRLREVRPMYGQSASAFLAEFQFTAASLKPGEVIKLVVYAYESSMELLKAVISDPQANKICSLQWTHYGKEDVTPIIPLLINSCPELASLEVYFEHRSTFDFVSSLLEHPSNRIKVLDISPNTKGDLARFFAALGQSQVSALTLFYSPVFAQSLHEYLSKDMLVRLKLWMNFEQVPLELMVSLADCTRLTKLEMSRCEFSQPTAFTHLPKSITTLTLNECTFVGGLDWSFLADSNVQELHFRRVKGVDGNQLGSALAVCLRAKGLAELRLVFCDFVDETLAVVGVEVGRIKRLMLEDGRVNDASVELIALTLQSPNNEMKELVLKYDDGTASSIENHLLPALKHPNCNLVKLSFSAYREHRRATLRVESKFRNRIALFVLLQGNQVRRRSLCPLRRLPVEMLRLVGATLI
ncbi:hypothetical protein BASA81_011056 [Batrachochytrium salamandrivorans]|nr:hypothetical protein BASA81_011056 [Batrachochytrium salamandrivorans]